MKKLLFIFIGISSFVSFSQNIDIKEGKEINRKDDYFVSHFIGQNSNGTFLLAKSFKGSEKGYLIMKLDNSQSVVSVKNINTKPYQPYAFSFMKGNIISVFTSLLERDKEVLLKYDYDTSTDAMIGEPKAVSELVLSPERRHDNSNFYLSFSPDSTKFMVASEFKSVESFQETTLDIYEFPSYKKIGSKKILNSDKIANKYASNYIVGNNGDVYYTFHFYVKEYYYEPYLTGTIGCLPIGSSTPVLINFPFNKTFLKNGGFHFMGDTLLFAGILQDSLNIGKAEAKGGVFSVMINAKDQSITNKNLIYFPEDVNEKLSVKRDNEYALEAANKSYNFDRVLIINDNIYLLESHYSLKFGGSGSIHTIQKEVIVTKLNKSLELKWMKIIPRISDLDFSQMIQVGDRIGVFYHEDRSNMERFTVDNSDYKDLELAISINKSSLVVCWVSESGTLKRDEIYTNKDYKFFGGSNRSSPTNQILKLNGPGNKYLFRLTKEGKQRYDVVSFD
jgi:hypothetical protein